MTVEAEYDATFPYFDTNDRRAEMLYSEPMHRQESRIYTRAGVFEPQLLADLEGKVVCNPLGYALAPSLSDMLADDAISIAQPDSMQTCLKQLNAGRLDAVSAGVIQARDTIDALGMNMADFAESPFPTTVNALHFLVSRSHANGEALIAQFNDGLETIRANGTFAEIEARHMAKYMQSGS